MLVLCWGALGWLLRLLGGRRGLPADPMPPLVAPDPAADPSSVDAAVDAAPVLPAEVERAEPGPSDGDGARHLVDWHTPDVVPGEDRVVLVLTVGDSSGTQELCVAMSGRDAVAVGGWLSLIGSWATPPWR